MVGWVALCGVATEAQTVFPVTGYQVQGNTLLSAQRVAAVTQEFTGPNSDFETIQRALEALEKAYLSEGYGSVKVEIPEQELDSGVVSLQVVEGVLGEVVVETNPYFDAANVVHSLPALRAGRSVNIFELNRNLVLANEGGSKLSTVTFKRNVNNKDVDVNVKVVAEDPQRWLLVLDNTGTAATGQYRVGLVYQHANVFSRDHALSVQLMTSPDHTSQVGIVGLGYKVPLYGWDGTLDFSASHSSVDSGQVAQAGGGPNLSISGQGDTVGMRYTHNVDSSAQWQHKVSVGLESRSYGNNVTTVAGGSSLVPSLATRPLSLGYTATYRTTERDTAWGATWMQNLPGGTNGNTSDFNQAGGRAGAKGDFQTLKFNLQWTERFASQWAFRASASAQLTDDLLIAPEQFGAGGADSVRGFGERELAADQGLRIGLELMAPALDMSEWRMIPLVFADNAMVKRNRPLAGEIGEQTVSSAGLGIRAAYGKHFSTRLDWGYVTQGVKSMAGTAASGPVTGDIKLHATFVGMF
jgi:hemolysin activation/secretion protein